MPQSLSFDRVADIYDATRGYPPAVAAAIAAAMTRLGQLHVGAEALEVGIGTGRIALPILAEGINVTGVDIAERMLARLDAKYAQLRASAAGSGYGRLVVRVADMTALPFADASFDAVIAVHVFHLVAGWHQALDEVLRVLRPAGSLLLGQDVHRGIDRARMGDIEERWTAILAEMGYQLRHIGAASYAAVREELEARGLTLAEETVATWETSHTPRQALQTITERTWSRTWGVPGDLFAESARRLTAWATATYGDRLDSPVATSHAFKLTRATRAGT
jgi:ubiquinone/menaquinone biosynthesis C-methylase UbiE